MEQIKNKYFIVFFLVIFGLFFQTVTEGKNQDCCNNFKAKEGSEQAIHKNLKKISQKDRLALERLFRYFFSDSFAYVLFGNKPVAITDYYVFKMFKQNKLEPLFEISHSFYQAYHPQNKVIKSSWNIWKKYSSFFTSSQYIFLEEPNPWNEQTKLIILVNKDLFIKTINLYKEDFQNVLKEDIDPEEFLRRSLKGETLLTDILQKHDGLIGTLLGYGRNNAWNYHKRQLLNLKANRSFKQQKNKENLNKKLLLFAKQDCQKTWDNIAKTLEVSQSEIIDYSYIPQDMFLPTFVADLSSEETKQLEKTYHEDRKKIQEKYKNKDFLTVTFKQLSSGN